MGGIKREIRDAKEPEVLGVACREQVLRKGSKRAGGEKVTTRLPRLARLSYVGTARMV